MWKYRFRQPTTGYSIKCRVKQKTNKKTSNCKSNSRNALHILTSVFGTWPLNSNPSRQPVHALKMKDFIFLKHLRNLERSPQAGGIFHHKPYYGMAQEMKANLTKGKKSGLLLLASHLFLRSCCLEWVEFPLLNMSHQIFPKRPFWNYSFASNYLRFNLNWHP